MNTEESLNYKISIYDGLIAWLSSEVDRFIAEKEALRLTDEQKARRNDQGCATGERE